MVMELRTIGGAIYLPDGTEAKTLEFSDITLDIQD